MSDVIIDGAVGRKLLTAWGEHGAFGPAFAEVYEQVTGVVDQLAELLRPPATAASVLADAKLYTQSTKGKDGMEARRSAAWRMRQAGLSLAAIGRLVEVDPLALARLCHNCHPFDGHQYLLLDDLIELHVAVTRMSELTGISDTAIRRTLKRLATAVALPCSNHDGLQPVHTQEAPPCSSVSPLP